MNYNKDTSASTGQLSSASSVGGGMHHSLSTPIGVDGGARTPPATPRKCGKMLAIRVEMLDDSQTIFQVQSKALGKVLFDQVCKQLHLLEADYFGLEYQDLHGTKYWLDLEKPVSRQLGLSLVDPLLHFCVKFYTPDPSQLEEEYTRYLFCLQVKRDLAQGHLKCNDNTAALMASYIVQAECGDFVAEDYPDHTYLSSYKFIPQQDPEMERKIMENHKKHIGQSPAEADLNLLETARRCELYGIKMHPVKDLANMPLDLAVAHMGIVVFQQNAKISTFSWAKIRKISFKRKRFLIKLHQEIYGYKDIVEFLFEGRNECKNFWKKCVENHGFFRCSSVKTIPRHKTRVLSRGSSFRYSGKTQKEIVEFVRDNYVKRQAFQRSASFRHTSSHASSANMHASSVGNSISAHPLLPLSDNILTAEVSKRSASLASMEEPRKMLDSPTMKSASLPQGTVMSWNSTIDDQHISQPAQTTSSPSPPLTMQSLSPITSATVSPQHMPYEDQRQTPPPLKYITNMSTSPPPLQQQQPAVVHKAETGTVQQPIRTIFDKTTTITNAISYKSDCRLDSSVNAQYSPHFTPQTTKSQSVQNNTVACYYDTPLQYTYKTSAGGVSSSSSSSKQQQSVLWFRSSSCRELNDYSFDDSGKRKHKSPRSDGTRYLVENRTLESPVTRYDDNRIVYTCSRNDSLEIHQDIMVPDQKVYSSSYPGTTAYSQESVEDPGNYDLRDSQDDVTHDSYELLERSDDDISGYEPKYENKNKFYNVRSCSLDSSNYYPPSDLESDQDHHHKHKVSKSSSDITYNESFSFDDPRYYPRERMPRKSDGSFYKSIKTYNSSRASSLESKNSDCYDLKPTSKRRKSRDYNSYPSRTSSKDSQSDKMELKSSLLEFKTADYYDSLSGDSDYFNRTAGHDYDRKIPFERNYGTQKKQISSYDMPSPPITNETSHHVHSVNLQNFKSDHNSYNSNHIINNFDHHVVPRTPSDFESTNKLQSPNDNNIFSFEEDRIQSFVVDNRKQPPVCKHTFSKNEISKKSAGTKRESFDDLFVDVEPKKIDRTHDGGFPIHQTIERTKSDPNSLARQRLSSGSRRHLLMHQKSIDITPAESSDDDYLFRQIPSAPPITTFKGSFFDMPHAEFGHFDVLTRDAQGLKTKFEVPKSQFEVLGAKTQSDLVNPLPKNESDIPYTLHKRHIMNGTAPKEEISTFVDHSLIVTVPDHLLPLEDEYAKQQKLLKPKSPTKVTTGAVDTEAPSAFLFTQNIDLSKVDPVTLEVDKTKVSSINHLSSPKRDITRIDPALFETLNSKLSQIESDSPTSSKTESLKPELKISKVIHKIPQVILKEDRIKVDHILHKSDKGLQTTVPTKILIKDKPKSDGKQKRGGKPRSQVKKGAKSNKTKVRITSFSSDDESLDSDDVFGSAEATPTKLEFSPPQTRKEMESILKFEAERKYLQYTMSSTEVEGSPPTTRKIEVLHYDRSLDPNFQTELRRISERSFSIPSSEDDLNINTADLQSVFQEVTTESTLTTVLEVDKEGTDKNLDSTGRDLQTDEITEISEGRTEPIFFDEFSKTESTEELQREKALLQSQIEQDLQDLQVPSKTKITELCSPSSSRKGHSPMLFAHARLNLSEGSAMTLLQKQQASESPLPGRRAKSLDTPVIAIHRLPPSTAFSSKDDTVDEENLKTPEVSEQEYTSDEVPQEEVKSEPVRTLQKPKHLPIFVETDLIARSFKDNDQIVPDVVPRHKEEAKISPTTALKEGIKEKPPKLPAKTFIDKSIKPARPAKTFQQKTVSSLSTEKTTPKQHSLTTPDKEIKRSKSQETESSKKTAPKEKAKSLEKVEFKRVSSKERSKSQEDSDTDVAKRKEKQQMLYETAIKQTKTLKSPVKEILPVFPQVEESVRERGGKLEISINTIENPSISLEEAIIITKSPKRLDKKMDKKLTQSLELNISDKNDEDGEDDKKIQRLGKSLDLENRPKKDESQELEFDFNSDTVSRLKAEDEKQSDKKGEEDAVSQDLILEGTSLDVWLSVNEKVEQPEKLGDITIIQKSNDFFEERTKPPDLGKTSTKSSSDSTSLEKFSLGNSLDIKYIDESGDSSYKSEKDSKLASELQRSTEIVSKYIAKKMERRRKKMENEMESIEKNLDKISPSIASLQRTDILNSLTLPIDEKKALTKLSVEKSRSEETGSWETLEYEEIVGTESSFETDAYMESPEKISNEFKIEIEADVGIKRSDSKDTPEEEKTLVDRNTYLTAEDKSFKKVELLKRSSDQSKSSDTGSWTSGEKDNSPGNLKETADESSASCAIGQAIGISQTIEKFSLRDQLEKTSPDVIDPPRSPRSPKICVLGRAFTIDEESYGLQNRSDESISEINDIPKSKQDSEELPSVKYKKSRYPFEEKWSDESELGQKIQQKIVKKLTSSDRNSASSVEEKRKNGLTANGRGALRGLEKLSADSKSSMDTESSSGSLGFAARLIKGGDVPETTSTWKAFPLESSGSSSIEDAGLSNGHDKDHEYFVSASKVDDDVTPSSSCDTAKDDLVDFPATFGYPSLTSNIGGIGLNIGGADILTGYSSTLLGRTLSRISERSSNSEKSSLDEDSTKASTHLDSLNEGSLTSSEHNASLSSDSPSNARKSDSDKKQPPEMNEPEKRFDTSVPSTKHSSEPMPNFNSLLLQRQISDDRRTSAEMAELSIDDIEIITSESGLRLKRQGSDDTVIDEECFEAEIKQKKGSSSQESEDWPLPDIPQQGIKDKNVSTPLFALHDAGSSDASQLTTQVFRLPQNDIPKVFGLRGSLKSQDSEPWPSPPSSIQEPIVVEKIETHYVTPEEPSRVVVGPSLSGICDDNSQSASDEEEKDGGGEEHIYENVPQSSGSFGSIHIILEEKCSDSPGSNSDDFNLSNLNDDVFVDLLDVAKMELRPPAALRRSTTSDDSSHSGHKTYSEEDHTSSLGTHLEDGTVRFAPKPTKRCTHSSHSEDTSIALSLSEWSNSTNTVKVQNLSTSNSAATKSSSGLKSDDNSLADIAPSLSEWSSSNSNTLKAQQNAGGGINFQRLSSSTSTGDSNTLTDFIQTVSEKSSSDSKTLIPQQFFLPPMPARQSISRLGSSVDDLEVPYEQKSLKSPQNIPSEDFAILGSSLPSKAFRDDTSKIMKKSTERPVTIPPDAVPEKSKQLRNFNTTDQNDKRRTTQKSNGSSSERPVKVPLSKCSPYYSSSLSSESIQMPISKTATVPLTRSHRRSLSKGSLHHAKPPTSENDSTSSVESPKSSVDRRALRRKKQRHRTEKEKALKDEYVFDKASGDKHSTPKISLSYDVDVALLESMYTVETLEEGYFPDGDSQSGSDVFRMERDDDNQSDSRVEPVEEFDLRSIPPPVLEDDFENDGPSTL